MTKTSSLSLLLAAAFVAPAAASAPFEQNASFFLEPAEIAARVGEEISFSVVLENPDEERIVAAQIWLEYDPETLEGVSATSPQGEHFSAEFAEAQRVVKLRKEFREEVITDAKIKIAEISFRALKPLSTKLSPHTSPIYCAAWTNKFGAWRSVVEDGKSRGAAVRVSKVASENGAAAEIQKASPTTKPSASSSTRTRSRAEEEEEKISTASERKTLREITGEISRSRKHPGSVFRQIGGEPEVFLAKEPEVKPSVVEESPEKKKTLREITGEIERFYARGSQEETNSSFLPNDKNRKPIRFSQSWIGGMKSSEETVEKVVAAPSSAEKVSSPGIVAPARPFPTENFGPSLEEIARAKATPNKPVTVTPVAAGGSEATNIIVESKPASLPSTGAESTLFLLAPMLAGVLRRRNREL